MYECIPLNQPSTESTCLKSIMETSGDCIQWRATTTELEDLDAGASGHDSGTDSLEVPTSNTYIYIRPMYIGEYP